MQFSSFFLALAIAIQTCLAQVFFDQPITYQLSAAHQPAVESAPPHQAVEINAAHEALLPPELLKSKRVYDNPHVASALAKESWFANKEFQVFHREAEKIPRERIYKLAKDAGFIRRR